MPGEDVSPSRVLVRLVIFLVPLAGLWLAYLAIPADQRGPVDALLFTPLPSWLLLGTGLVAASLAYSVYRSERATLNPKGKTDSERGAGPSFVPMNNRKKFKRTNF